jgi:hypothetical protein
VAKAKYTPFEICGVEIKPGERKIVDLPTTQFYTNTHVTIPVHVIRGKKDGPRLFVSAAIHGDEINGVEIIRRLLKKSRLKRLHGTLIAIPVVNIHGFVQQTRYLPDRRDLNRSFPGKKKGSLAARLAYTFMSEIVEKCTHGIDLHTGAIHRSNLPQIRANLDDPDTAQLAKAFSVPVMLNSKIRDGSLREAASELGIPMLLYESGEALRFDEVSIRAGIRGIMKVMIELGMLPKPSKVSRAHKKTTIAQGSLWVRSPSSGIVGTQVTLGAQVSEGQQLGVISDPFSNGDKTDTAIKSPCDGIVIGQVNIPLVYEGDALFHIAYFGEVEKVTEHLEAFVERIMPEASADTE